MGSLKVNLKKLRFQGKITNEEYESFIKKLDGHDEQIRICERAKAIDEVKAKVSAYDFGGWFEIETELFLDFLDTLKEPENEHTTI